MKIKSSFWTAQILGCLLFFACNLLDQILTGTAIEPYGLLTVEGLTLAVLVSIIVIANSFLLLLMWSALINRKNKTEAMEAFGLPDDSPIAESPMEYINRHLTDDAALRLLAATGGEDKSENKSENKQE